MKNKSLISAVVDGSTELASVATKIDKPMYTDVKPDPKLNYINALVTRAKDKKETMEDIIALFPDIELSMQLLVSSIVSPQTMVTDDFFLRLSKVRLPEQTKSAITTLIKKRLVNEYDFSTVLSEMPREVLFSYGSYTKVVIPENVIDSIVNSSMSTEGISEVLHRLGSSTNGILGGSTVISVMGTEGNTPVRRVTEPITSRINNTELNLDITVSDNIAALQAGDINDVKKSISVEERISKTSKDETIDGSLFMVEDDTPTPYIEVPKQNKLYRQSITRPLVMKIPPSAVIPVHAPGEPKKQLGIFIPIGENGFPLTKIIEPDDIRTRLKNKLNTKTNLIKTAAKTLYGTDSKTFREDEGVTKFYKAVIEKDLRQRLTNGIYKGSEFKIADVDHVYNTLLARTLEHKKTKLIFVPIEYYTYFCADIYDNGIGRSLLDKLTIISSIRAMLLFARYTAMIRNSVPNTLVKVTLPENVTDPEKLADKIVSMVMNGFGTRSAVGIMKVADLSEWVSKLGLEFSFEGHPALEGASIDYERRDTKIEIPDDTLEEELRIRTIQAFGLTPEQVDSTLSPDFATSLVINNALFTKRIMEYHKIFNPQLSDYGRKICKADATITTAIKDVLKEDITHIKKLLKNNIPNGTSDDVLINTLTMVIIDHLSISYPQPDNVMFKALAEQYDEYTDSVDKAIDAVLSSDIVDNDLAGDIADNIDTIREVFKAYLLRKWMADKNYMPELLELANAGKDKGINLSSVVSDHTKALMEAALDYAKKVAKTKKKVDKGIEKVKSGEEDEEPDNTDDNTPEEDTGDDNTGDDTGTPDTEV